MAVVNLTTTEDTYYGTVFSPGPNDTLTSLAFGGAGDAYYAYLKFDLSSIPVGSTITQALFRWYSNGTPSFDPQIQTQRVTSSWTGSTLTRTNLPTIDATNRGTLANPVGGSYTGGDITSLVQDWFTGASTNFGIRLNSTFTSGSNGSAQSREGANAPYLEVTYTPPVTNKGAFFALM